MTDVVIVRDEVLVGTIIAEPETTRLVMAPGGLGPPGPQGPAGVGSPGPQGPAGPTGGTFTFTQANPSASWTISHGMGFNPAVSVVDSSERLVEGDVSYPDLNTVVVSFAGAFSGSAYLS